MSISGCFAREIVVDPRLPFATRTDFVRGPEGHLTKALGDLWARTLFFLLISSSFRHVLPIYQISEHTLLHTYRDSIGLQADTQVSWFLRLHLDCFFVTRQLSSSYRDLVPLRLIIVTRDFFAFCRDLQKPRHRDADGT
jgi:hypothetical protein